MKINEKSSTKKSVDKKPKYDAEYEQTLFELLDELKESIYDYRQDICKLADKKLSESEETDIHKSLRTDIDKITDIINDIYNFFEPDVPIEQINAMNNRIRLIVNEIIATDNAYRIQKRANNLTNEDNEEHQRWLWHLNRLSARIAEYNTSTIAEKMLTFEIAKTENEILEKQVIKELKESLKYVRG